MRLRNVYSLGSVRERHSLPVTCATCCESYAMTCQTCIHRLDVTLWGLLAGDRLPHGADYPLPVRQTPRPAAGLKAKFYSSACSSPKTYQKPAACGFSFVWWLWLWLWLI